MGSTLESMAIEASDLTKYIGFLWEDGWVGGVLEGDGDFNDNKCSRSQDLMLLKREMFKALGKK